MKLILASLLVGVMAGVVGAQSVCTSEGLVVDICARIDVNADLLLKYGKRIAELEKRVKELEKPKVDDATYPRSVVPVPKTH